MKKLSAVFCSVFTALAFSQFAFADVASPMDRLSSGSPNVLAIAACCIAAAVIVCVTGIIILRRIRKKNNRPDGGADSAGSDGKDDTI